MTESLEGKTVFITGATGFLGGALTHRLSHDGVHIKALARRPDRDRYIRDLPNVDVVMGDITDLPRMRELIAGCDYVLHVAAALSGLLDVQQPINESGTRNVAQAVAEAGVKRLIHVSSVATYGYGYKNTVITEDMPFTPSKDPYVITKVAAEYALFDVASGSELASWSVIRPGMIYGPRSGFWTRTFFQIARRRPMLWLGPGDGHTFPVYIDDVVDMIVTQLTHPNAHEQIFNCAPDPAPTWRVFLQGYQSLLDRQSWLGIPASPVIAALDVLTLFQKPMFMEYIRYSQTRNTYSMQKARELLGWEPTVTLADGIQHCVPYLREKGLLR